MSTFQDNTLKMAGIGNNSEPRFEKGIHLRWSFAAETGFPQFGFDLYRREAKSANRDKTCVDYLKIPLSKALKSFTFSTVTVTSSASIALKTGTTGATAIVPSKVSRYVITDTDKLREFYVREYHAAGRLTMQAYDGNRLVAQATRAASSIAGKVTVKADRFDKVIIRCDPTAKIELYQICWQHVADCTGTGLWNKIATLRLPRKWDEAKVRIPSAAAAQYQNSYRRLQKVINMVRAGDTGPQMIKQSGVPRNATPAFFGFEPVKLLLFAASDPFVARMLGIYYLDDKAAAGTVYDYKVAGNWTGPNSAEYAWICFGLSKGTPTSIRRPSGLAARQRRLIGGVSGAPASQVGVGLTWDIPRTSEGLVSGTAIMYDVSREKKKPDGSWTAAKRITEKRAVIVAPNSGSLPAYFYTDGPLATGRYRYRIHGIDIWGRRSAASATATITLADDVPPPPGNVSASPAMQAGPTGNIVVRWEWTRSHVTQAGDAAEFLIYYQNTGINPLTGHITKVTDNCDGTSDLETDMPAGSYTDYADGFLVNTGRRFSVISISASSTPVVIKTANLTGKSDDDPPIETTVIPEATGTASAARDYLVFLSEPWKQRGKFLLIKDWSDPAKWQPDCKTAAVAGADSYSEILEDIDFGTSGSAPVGRVMVGVCTIDKACNIGKMSPPVFVAAYHKADTTEVDSPGTPGGAEYASWPDYFCNSYYTVSIGGIRSDYRYELYRAVDASVAAAEGVAAELEGITDAELSSYAENHEEAFIKIGTMTVSGSTATFEDTLCGTGRNRYLYRVKAYDAAGNPGKMTAVLIVKLHDVMPPKAPVITKLKGEENRITVQWAVSPNEDLTGYELYRTSNPESAGDYRVMNLLKTNEEDGFSAEVPSMLPEKFEFADSDVTAGTTYYYGLIAVRRNTEGDLLRSAMSKSFSGQAYDLNIPVSPAISIDESGWIYIDDAGEFHALDEDLTALVNPTLVIRIIWEPTGDGMEYNVQRLAGTETTWTTVMDWDLGTVGESGSFYCMDYDADSSLSNLYRVRARSGAGLISKLAGEVTINANE